MNIKKSKRRKLRTCQRTGYYYCNRVDNPALFMEMRLGKTLLVIRYLLLRYNFTLPIVISAPYSALFAWREELLNEGFTKNDINFLTGERSERFKKLQKPKTFNLINKEGFLYLPEFASKQWGVSIIDESTFIKNPDSKVSNYYTDNFDHVNKKFILTGTPMPESELDIYQQLLYLDPEILPFDNYYEFRYKLFTQGTRVKRRWLMTRDGKEYLTKKLAKHTFVMTRKEAGLGGEKVYEKRYLYLSKSDRKVYNTIAKEFLLEYENSVIKVTDWATTKFIWLRQLCSGFIKGADYHRFIHHNKYNEVIALLKGELKNNQVILWTTFTQELLEMQKLLIKNNISTSTIYGKVKTSERERRRVSFNKGNLQTIICEAKCFEFGANLASADVSIYLSSPLSTLTRKQTEDRMIDASCYEPDLVIDLITENTIEEDIYNNVMYKGNNQSLLLDIITRLQKDLK